MDLYNRKLLDDFSKAIEPTIESNCSNVSTYPTVDQQLRAFGSYSVLVYVSSATITALTLAMFLYLTFRITRFAPSRRRTMILWVTATPIVLSFLSFVGMLLPKANYTCKHIKSLYMPWVLMHLVDLTLDYHGGIQNLLPRLESDGATLALEQIPCCCAALIWGKVLYNKHTMRVARALVYQFPLIQFVFVFLGMILEELGYYKSGYVGFDNSYIYLTTLKTISFFIAEWGVNLFVAMSASRLAHIKYGMKIHLVQLFILFVKAQTTTMQILGDNGVIPCVLPYLSVNAFESFLENGLLIVECCLISIPIVIEYQLRRGSLDRKDVLKEMEARMSPATTTSDISSHAGVTRSVSSDVELCKEFVEFL
ncbi:organic solute transporter subunit alpha-like [Artemia franciscana]|uniref:organic solute transporter subunit alpha-like n=1 Tax=Artemia franciscana TaxID=6661 RepID=UPI0032DA20AC